MGSVGGMHVEGAGHACLLSATWAACMGGWTACRVLWLRPGLLRDVIIRAAAFNLSAFHDDKLRWEELRMMHLPFVRLGGCCAMHCKLVPQSWQTKFIVPVYTYSTSVVCTP